MLCELLRNHYLGMLSFMKERERKGGRKRKEGRKEGKQAGREEAKKKKNV